MVIDSVKEITQYRVFFYPDEHPEIFEAPRYKRKSMCMEVLESEFDLVDPIIRGEWLGADKIELLVYSLHPDL